MVLKATQAIKKLLGNPGRVIKVIFYSSYGAVKIKGIFNDRVNVPKVSHLQ